MVLNDDGRTVNPSFRNYHIPHFADSPRTEVLFAKTYDAFGPSGAKSAAEGAFDPVAPALANAIADATGLRFHSLLLAPYRIYQAISDNCSDGLPQGQRI